MLNSKVSNESTVQLAEVQKQISCIQSCIEKLSRNLAELATTTPHIEPVCRFLPSLFYLYFVFLMTN